MKKKIFLTVAIISVLVCIFILSASAAEPSYKDGEWIYAADGVTKLAIKDTDGNPLIWYLNGEELKYVRADQTDETQSVYVKYAISGVNSKYNGWSGLPNATEKCLKDIDIYDNGVQIECIGDKSALVIFNMERLDIEAINSWLWGSKHGCCPNMRGIVFPNTLKYIGQEALTNTKLVQIWNIENTQLEYMNACDWNTPTLTQEATNGVFKCPQTFQAPINVQYSKIKTYIMNPVSTFNTCQKWYQFLRQCENLQKVYVSSHYSIGFGEEAFRQTPNQYIVFFTGTEEEAISMRDNTQQYCNDGFKAGIVISYEEYLADQTTYDDATNQVYIVYGYNYCDAFYDGTHDDIGNDCVIQCQRCDSYDGTMKASPKHNYEETISYVNYLASGVKTQTCQNEGCVHNITPNEIAVDAIIKEFKGVSVKEKGNGLTFGYIINHCALDEYIQVNNSNVELGFVVAVKAFLGENQPLAENGERVSDKVIKFEIYNSSTQTEKSIKYTGADFVLNGNWNKTVDLDNDGTEETDIKNVLFCMSGYIIDGGELSYINSEASGKEADTVYYNQIN